MGGIFGVASKSSCILDLFFGIDYHSHLGTRRGGMAVYDKKRGFDRVIHNIENAPFRTKFDGDIGEMEGNLGIGCISDNEPQPLLVRSHLGNFAITTVGKINNMDELIANCFKNGCTHFLEMSGGSVNPTEMVAALINQKDNMIEGIRYAQEVIEGSMTMLILTPKGILAARDRLGRTPLIVGKKEDACCVSFESFAYLNLGYEDLKELGPGGKNDLWINKCLTVYRIELVNDLLTLLDHRHLILSNRNLCGLECCDICSLADRITEESNRDTCLEVSHLDLCLNGRISLDSCHCYKVHIVECELCELWYH